MPKRCATISAVDPMESFTTGSVRPWSKAITGANRVPGRSFAMTATFCAVFLAEFSAANHFTIARP